MAEVRKLVILGASFGGLGTFHYLAKHVLPQLNAKGAKGGATYEIHLVDESSRFWWHIAAPRQIVSMKDLSIDKTFIPYSDILKQYPNLKNSLFFVQGSATALDTEARTVTIAKTNGASETLPYYALVIATGVRSPTPLTTFHGDYTISQKALEEMNSKLGTAKEIIIAGGGPVGVETAGEIGFHLKGKAKVTLIAGSDKLLPALNDARATKAQKLLEKVGVTVLYGVKVSGAEQNADGTSSISLDNGKSLNADIYIPANGITPNSGFVPESLKTKGGYIATNKETMRLDAAGPRVYAAGDIAGVDKGGVMNMYASLAVLHKNFANDLLLESTDSKNIENSKSTDKKYSFTASETQVVPVGPKAGVGAFNGWSVPGFMVSIIKGKDYMVSMGLKDFTEGKRFTKAL